MCRWGREEESNPNTCSVCPSTNLPLLAQDEERVQKIVKLHPPPPPLLPPQLACCVCIPYARTAGAYLTLVQLVRTLRSYSWCVPYARTAGVYLTLVQLVRTLRSYSWYSWYIPCARIAGNSKWTTLPGLLEPDPLEFACKKKKSCHGN